VVHSANVYSESHAAILLHQWPSQDWFGNYYSIPTTGDYTDSDISNNWIECGPNQNCGFGLSVGPGNWYPEPTNVRGGYIHDNTIFDAQLGFSIERANWITVDKIAVGTYASKGTVWSPSVSPFYAKDTPPYYQNKCAALKHGPPAGVLSYNIDPYSNIQVLDWGTMSKYYSRVDMEGCILDD